MILSYQKNFNSVLKSFESFENDECKNIKSSSKTDEKYENNQDIEKNNSLL